MERKYFNKSGLFLMSAFFLSIGFCATVFAFDKKELDNYLHEEIKKPFFKASKKGALGKVVVPNRIGSEKFKFIMPKPVGKKRIFIIGESVAQLMRWPDCAFVGELIDNPEIINCGMCAYDSGRILDVFSEVMDYQPDLAVVLSGNNEMALESRRGLSAEMSRRLRMIKINAGRIFKGLDAKESKHFVGIKIHESRLRKMAKTAKKKKVPLILCTLPSNMSDFPPSGYLPFEIENFAKAFFLMESGAFKKAEKIFRVVLAENPRESFVHFYLAKTLERLNRFGEAKHHYQLAIEWDNMNDRSSMERNEMIRKVAKEEGVCLADLEKSFMSAAKNEIIGGDYIVDGVHWFGGYNDFVVSEILKYAGNCKIADTVFKKDKAARLLKLKSRVFKKNGSDDKEEHSKMFHYAIAFIGNKEQRERINERALMMLDRVYQMDDDIVLKASKSKKALKKRIKDNFWTNRLAQSMDLWHPDFYHHLSELFRRRGEFDKAKKNIDKALALMPQAHRFLFTKRLIFEGMKKNALAGALIDEASNYGKEILQREERRVKNEKLKLQNKRKRDKENKKLSEAAYIRESKEFGDMGVKKFMAGDIEGAKTDFKKALKINPDNIEAQVSICSINLSQKHFDAALKYCDAAAFAAEFPAKHSVILPGILADILLTRAEIYGSMKEYEKAVLDLKKALKKAPPSWVDLEKAGKKLKNFEKIIKN